MEKIEFYNSVLAAIEFKNPYDDVAKFLEKNESLKEIGFNPIVADLNPNYGVKMLRLLKNKLPAKIQVNQIRIQYEDNNKMSVNEVSQISKVMDELQEAHNIINSNRKIEFKGVILKTTYELEEDELSKIKDKFFGYGDKFERGELKLNFISKDKLNYNIFFVLQNDSKLLVDFDINTRLVDNQDDWSIKDVIDKIIKYTENPVKILNIINIETEHKADNQ
ncbi:MAG: hypothetical protein KAS78_01880 [Candidatus Pacebacteria bacterium]|nr:hypothetical protein [Candidatus Paceibacterota bacterium]